MRRQGDGGRRRLTYLSENHSVSPCLLSWEYLAGKELQLLFTESLK